MMKNSRGWLALAAVLGLGVLGSPGVAKAAPETLRPGPNSVFFDAGAGFALNIDNYTSQFKLTQEMGVHLRGGTGGPAIGGAIAESFGDGYFLFQAGFKFWWDIQVSDLGLYIAPFGVAGFAVDTLGGGNGYFNFQFGGQVKLIINRRWNVWVRPVAFDFFAGDQFRVRYDFMAGGVITF